MYNLNNIATQKNLLLAYRRLITNPESTYKNFFRDSYIMYGMAVDENLKMLCRKLRQGYLPAVSIRVFMPKSNGLNRMYTLLSIEDQIVYQAFANVIGEALTSNKNIKNRYKKSVFGNLFSNSDSLFFYQRWQDSYKAYTKAVIKSYESGNIFIASFDLTACYDSINHILLKTVLQNKCHFSEACAGYFINLIGKWETSSGMQLGTGIPQGPQASGIIAEAVLEEYDSYLDLLKKRYDFCYYRYVDDIRILAPEKQTVQWILFLLDKKSKELGLFPQASKISVHQIIDIDSEVKRISKPLFNDDDINDTDKSSFAGKAIRNLLKQDPVDLTTVKRYFQFVEQNSKSNAIAIKAVKQYPNMIHSFAYYVQRYPRKIPPSISNYILELCKDRTQQFAAGILLEASVENLSTKDKERYLITAKDLLSKDKKEAFIVDDRLRSQLWQIVILYDKKIGRRQENDINKLDWWCKSKILYQAQKNSSIEKIGSIVEESLKDSSTDIALSSAYYYLLKFDVEKLPPISSITPYAQYVLKKAGIIQRSRYTNSQINKYLNELLNTQYNFHWKKYLKKEHDQIERILFTCLGYWNTDLTAFVNMWDTLDDRLCSLVTADHLAELGGYSLGQIGGLKDSKKLRRRMPKYHKMCMEIHKLRLESYLSHTEVKETHKYTGPIKQNKRKVLLKLINDGISELVEFW